MNTSALTRPLPLPFLARLRAGPHALRPTRVRGAVPNFGRVGAPRTPFSHAANEAESVKAAEAIAPEASLWQRSLAEMKAAERPHAFARVGYGLFAILIVASLLFTALVMLDTITFGGLDTAVAALMR